MSDKDINNLKEMLIDFNEYSTDYTKTRCRELEETIENTLEEIERLNSIIKEVREYIGINEELRKVCTNYDVNGIDILEILDKENNND